MQKIIFLFAITLSISGYSQKKSSEASEKEAITQLLNDWHKAASEADYKNYFDKLDENSIFIGTDATENWNKKEFEAFSKPYFDRGKAWNFRALERNIYFSNDKKFAWFDELLDTQMKICRGSGVLEKTKNGWKIKHYVLSMTVPNDNVDEVIKVKEDIENKLIESLRRKS